jgi:tRNA threonylcarbamoyladenosine biosynthesis protein TsaE
MANAHIEKALPGGRCRCESEEETRRAGRDFSAELRTPVVLSLEGPMGAGKTCFVKGLAEGLGCDPDDVSSPTFTLVHEYGGGRLPLVHMDLYRIEDAAELAALGFDDLLSGDALVAIEWGGKFALALPPETLRLAFSIEGTARCLHLLA